MIRSGDRIATGVEDTRRRLTLEEASAGALPDLMTRAEWHAAHMESVLAEQAARKRHAQRYWQAVTITTDDEHDEAHGTHDE